MPAGDGTGPLGLGPMTGRRAGYCADYGVPGYANPAIPRMGMGWRRGWGLGWGRGWSGRWAGGWGGGWRWRHWYYATGLPAGFLQAGVPAVIGPLWSVDDASTALLMTRTYELMLEEGKPPAQALRQAQRWLRDLTHADLEAYLTHHEKIARARLESGRRMPLTLLEELLVKVISTDDPQARPYADPYFWAPFTFTGVEEVTL